MKPLEKFIRSFLTWGTLISSLGFISAVVLQIVARFLLEKAPPWTEEASRLFFVYAMSFAAGLALNDQEFVSLDLLYDRLSPSWKRVFELVSAGLVLLLFGVMTYFSLSFIQLGSLEASPSLKIPMAWAFLSMAILGAGICFYALKALFFSPNP